MKSFIAPQWLSFMHFDGQPIFDAIWAQQGNWVEPPNIRRGGWSGVSRLNLHDTGGNVVPVYIKRQENHCRPSLRHPIKGEATFGREYRIIKRLRDRQVPTLNPLYFGERVVDGANQAILMTESLEGYQSMETLLDDGEMAAMAPVQKRRLISALARTVRQMHDAGVQHRSLYPKHLMVKQDEGFSVALIDLEKSRRCFIPFIHAVRDLSTLNRHSPTLSRSQRLWFLREYLGVRKLGPASRWLARLITGRASRKESAKRG